MENTNENIQTPSVEELNQTIKGLQDTITKLQGDLEKQKQATSNASSDAADWKKKFRETQDEGTRKAAETEDMISGLRSKLAELEMRDTVSGFEKNYLALGYDASLARTTAEAMAKGDMATVFANQKSFNDSQAQAIQDRLLNNMPDLTKGKTPPAPGDESEKSAADFRKAMGL